MARNAKTFNEAVVGFRPTPDQRSKIEAAARQLGSPGRLSVGLRWLIERAPDVRTGQAEAGNEKRKSA